MGKLSCPETLLKKVMLKAGAYYQPADLFYQRLWRRRLQQIGFRVISVERIPTHPIWDIRLRGTLAVQTYLLVSKPPPKQAWHENELLLKQLRAEVQQIAKELGEFVKSDCLMVNRNGTYVRLVFVWSLGKPGVLRPTVKKAEAFSFMIRPWLRRIGN